MSDTGIRKARLGHFFDGQTRINVRLEGGKLAFNRHRSRKMTYAAVPFLELYHASIGQLALPGMMEAWGLKLRPPEQPKPAAAPEPEITQPEQQDIFH